MDKKAKDQIIEPASINIELLLEMPDDEDLIEANLYSVFDEIKFEVKPKQKPKRRKHSAEDLSDLQGNHF